MVQRQRWTGGALTWLCKRVEIHMTSNDTTYFTQLFQTISDNNIGQWLPFPPYPLPNVVLQVQKNIERKVDIIVATLKEGKRGRAFVWGWPETFGWDCRFLFAGFYFIVTTVLAFDMVLAASAVLVLVYFLLRFSVLKSKLQTVEFSQKMSSI